MADPEVDSFIQRLFTKPGAAKGQLEQLEQEQQAEKQPLRSEQPVKPQSRFKGKSLDEMTTDEIIEMHKQEALQRKK